MITIEQSTETIKCWIKSANTMEQLNLLRKVVREFIFERYKDAIGEPAAQVEAELLLVEINDKELLLFPMKDRAAIKAETFRLDETCGEEDSHITTESTFI
jgi:hypothetical protein